MRQGGGKMPFRILPSFIFMAIVILVGCSPKVWHYPGRSEDCQVEIENLDDYINPSKYFQKYAEASDKKTCRNEIINAHIFAIDCFFYEKMQIISYGRSGVSLFSDLAVLGLNIAGGVVPATTAKTILSPVAAGITGAKTPIDKNLFYEQTMPALISKNEALRLKVKAEIYEKMQDNITKYPLSAALDDLLRYQQAGTIHYALVGITVDAGKSAKEAQEKIEKIEIQPNKAREFIKKFIKPDGLSINLDKQKELIQVMKKHDITIKEGEEGKAIFDLLFDPKYNETLIIVAKELGFTN
jgi:hypothetical protein